MNELEKPLPCPFCGSDPCIDRKHDRLGVQVRCFNTQCPAKPAVSHQYGDVALHSWNTRHTSEIPNLWGNLTFTDPNQENMDYLVSQGWKKHPSANVFRKNGRSWLTVKAACVAQQMYDQFHTPDAVPKVEDQLEKDIKSLKVMAAPPVPEHELVMHSLVGGGDIYRDITPPENQLAPLVRTILHLLKR